MYPVGPYSMTRNDYSKQTGIFPSSPDTLCVILSWFSFVLISKHRKRKSICVHLPGKREEQKHGERFDTTNICVPYWEAKFCGKDRFWCSIIAAHQLCAPDSASSVISTILHGRAMINCWVQWSLRRVGDARTCWAFVEEIFVRLFKYTCILTPELIT